MPGVSFPPLGRCSRLGVAGFSQGGPPVFFRGPRGCRLWCCLGGGFARLLWSGCAASRLCVCLLPAPFFFAGGRALLVLGGGFPTFCAVCLFPFVCFFPGGCLPVPPATFPGLVHALVGIRCG